MSKALAALEVEARAARGAVRERVAEVTELEVALNKARTGLHQAIRTAHAVRVPQQELADLAGLSRQRVNQIVQASA